jgi:tetratricopeptide (TPR) repeat protein
VAKLVVFRGDDVEKEIHLSGKPLRIGRHERNDVILDDSANGVSRFHAELRPDGANYVIVDLQSRNGIWINGRRIKEKAPLTPGVPATIGAFELTLEDDASSGEFNLPTRSANAPTVVASSGVRGTGSGTASGRSGASVSALLTTRRQALLWTALTATLLVIAVVTFAVVRSKTRPAPPAQVVEAPVPPPPVVKEELPPPPPVDVTKQQVDQHLAEARVQMDARDYEGALRDHILPALELDPDNVEARTLKQQVDQAIEAKTRKAVSPPKPPEEPETPGIPRKQNEPSADYATRVKRIQTSFTEGRAKLDRGDFAGALSSFRAVEREQPRYEGVDQLIGETREKQRQALSDSMNGGQRNEAAGNFRAARLFYMQAMRADPSSAEARDKAAAMRDRTTADAEKLFTTASTAEKLGENARATKIYQQIVDSMLDGDEVRERAKKRLEALKQ